MQLLREAFVAVFLVLGNATDTTTSGHHCHCVNEGITQTLLNSIILCDCNWVSLHSQGHHMNAFE